MPLKAAHAELPAPEPDPEPTPGSGTHPGSDTPDTPRQPGGPHHASRAGRHPGRSRDAREPGEPQQSSVQDATPDSTVAALPKTGVNWFTALAMALSGMALTVAGAFTSLFAKSKH